MYQILKKSKYLKYILLFFTSFLSYIFLISFLRLESFGCGIGMRVVELLSCRERVTRREVRVVGMLQYICSNVWKYLFNKAADNLERSTENEDECKTIILLITLFFINFFILLLSPLFFFRFNS